MRITARIKSELNLAICFREEYCFSRLSIEEVLGQEKLEKLVEWIYWNVLSFHVGAEVDDVFVCVSMVFGVLVHT